MTNKPRIRGTRWETSIVNYLRARGFPHVERRALHGSTDKGDFTGIIGVCIEAKAEKRYDIPGWLRELDAEIINSGAETGAVWAKLVGRADAEHGFIVMRPAAYVDLLLELGYGQARLPRQREA